jgi:hypothetical protein
VLYDASSFQRLDNISVSDCDVWGAEFLSEQELIAFDCRGRVYRCRLDRREVIETAQLKFPGTGFSRIANLVFVATPGGVQVLDTEKGTVTDWAVSCKGVVRSLIWLGNGRLMLLGNDRFVRICDVASGQLLFLYREHQSPIKCAAYDWSAGTVVSCGARGDIRRWSPSAQRDQWTSRPADGRGGEA